MKRETLFNGKKLARRELIARPEKMGKSMEKTSENLKYLQRQTRDNVPTEQNEIEMRLVAKNT